jgi:DNA polymerase V
MYALIDCNNFYASCERAFNPALKLKPLVVLSNNDGCVIARSDEAKQLGIAMGAPYFKIKAEVAARGIEVRSSNYELYGDMSRRVMDILRRLAPSIEIYSIDEAFCDLTGLSSAALLELGRTMRETILQWTGIPTSVGIARTKTLAKAASKQAKLMGGVFAILDERERERLLQAMPLRRVWGIGRRLETSLENAGIFTAADLVRKDDAWIRRRMSITGLRTVHELRGIPCIDLDDQPASKLSITTSRMFGHPVHTIEELSQAVAHYVTRAAEKLRGEKRKTRYLDVFFHSSPFKSPYHAGRAAYALPAPTDFTPTLLQYAMAGVRAQYREGVAYTKAGIMLSDFVARGEEQLSLLQAPADEREETMMEMLDYINRRWGKHTMFYAGAGVQQGWSMKRNFRSPSYSTRLTDVLEIG